MPANRRRARAGAAEAGAAARSPPAAAIVAAEPSSAPPTPTVARRAALSLLRADAVDDGRIRGASRSDILDLTESMTTRRISIRRRPSRTERRFKLRQRRQRRAQPPQFRKIEGFSDVSFDESEPKPAVPPRRRAVSRSARWPAIERGLLSSATSAAVDSAFNTLAQTVLVQNARTLEDLVREMLRPMLKSWLDDNLPGMVERLVRAEIERVARGR